MLGGIQKCEGVTADPGFREGGSPGGLRSVVVIKESPCPRGPIYKSLSLFLNHKVLEIFNYSSMPKAGAVYVRVIAS